MLENLLESKEDCNKVLWWEEYVERVINVFLGDIYVSCRGDIKD